MPQPLEKLVKGDIAERVQAIKQITDLFWAERLVYVAVILLSLLMLLFCAATALIQHRFEDTQRIITESSGGVCVTSAFFLLYMWNKALNLALRMDKDKKADD